MTRQRSRSRSTAIGVSFVCFLVVYSASAACAKPTYQTFSAGQGFDTQPLGINNDDVVVGDYYNATNQHGFLRAANGDLVTVDVKDALNTLLVGINSKGDAVGDYNSGISVWHVFIRYKNGKTKAVHTPGSDYSAAAAINSNDAVAGSMMDAAGNMHGFLRASRTQFVEFDYPGADQTQVASMNDDGVIAGTYTTGDATHAFIRTSSGTFESVDPPGSAQSAFLAIQNDGAAFGYYDKDLVHSMHVPFYRTPDGKIMTLDIGGSIVALGRDKKGTVYAAALGGGQHDYGLLWFPDGTTARFEVPGGQSTDPRTLNAKGDVVGSTTDSAGNTNGFIRIH